MKLLIFCIIGKNWYVMQPFYDQPCSQIKCAFYEKTINFISLFYEKIDYKQIVFPLMASSIISYLENLYLEI